MSQFPLTASHEWRQSAMHMKATVRLTGDGQLQADIRTWSTWKMKGFTGGCQVRVHNANGTVLFEWVIHPLGVDGKWTGRHTRNDSPVISIPGESLAGAHTLTVSCRHMSKEFLERQVLPEIRRRAVQFVLTSAGGIFV